ncbi:PREDICTED: kinesin-like protein KIF19 isoform X2 [Chinchilla lanigera]|uniref:kinesin-like protein KIF19 isoform X2 n=1 Tax=Chinchilla lanigera TaxID=34839 RepID=UPI00069898DB|nr:PREDICTED: kinesin-like protein KIF19 isoform X2 [Chinchilla lanigera]
MKDSGDSKDQQLMVALRVRPISVAELEEGATLIAHKVDEQMVVLMDPMEDPDDILRAHRSREKSYLFDVAFDFTATQEMVYQATTKGLIEGVISGYNATVFAYGPTGCGKTYTMLGTDHEPGIYVRTLNDLFRAIEETSSDMEYEVSMSYLEIYNEMIRDLLNPTLGYLELREDSKGAIQVAGITEVSTINANEVMQLLMKGNQQRTQEPTAANQTSSRSHAVLQVAVRQRSRIKSIMQETQNRGQRMKEGAHINRSLLALGNCINALSDKGSNKYVNYRDSKLTRLLKDSLGGNSRTVMIAHISPASTAFEESRNTLTYAGRAKNIKTRVKQNLLNVSYHIAQYTSIIEDLRGEIQRLKGKIKQQAGWGPAPGPLERGDIRHIQAEVQQQGEQAEMRVLHAQLTRAFQEQTDVRRRLLELEKRAGEIEIEMETSCHLLTIAGWKRKKRRGALKWCKELRKESYTKDDSEKDSDTGSDAPDDVEPPEVASARESLTALVDEQRKLHKEKLVLQQRCRQELRTRCRCLEETLLRLIGSEKQREVLSLLCWVHELEMENTEMQSQGLLRVCDKIIQAQRQLIDDYNLPVPQHLENLCEVYLQEQEEGGLEQATVMGRVASRALKDSFLPQIIPVEVTLTSDSDPESVNTLHSEAQHLQNTTLPPITMESLSPGRADLSATSLVNSHPSSSAIISKAPLASKTRPRAWPAKSSSVPIPPPIPVGSLVTQEAPPSDSLGCQIHSSPASSENLSEIPLSQKEGKEILTGTKSISVKAARRRSRALAREGRHLLAPATERSSLSLNSLSEADDAGPPSLTLHRAASEDNLSSSTSEAPSQAIRQQGDGPGPWLRGQKKSTDKKREESLEAKKRKRRSLEVAGQGAVTVAGTEAYTAHGVTSLTVLQPTQLSRPKTHVHHPPESTSDHKVPACRHPAPNNQHLGKVVLPLAKIRLPPSEGTGSGDTLPLIVTSNTAGISRRPTHGPRLPHGSSTHCKEGPFRHN